ncbi:hypothetical protein J4E08_13975 [Sagittula sp. NFXS13]|uniref:hypothetical protein n=1 Tax=Sagittula sp. NFXS13 TaxID=2819095 RepID=UPI0032DF2821
MHAIFVALFSCLVLSAAPAKAGDRAIYLDLARSGWGYQLRSTMLRRDMSIPVRINGRDLSGSALCVVGERPNARTQAVLNSFSALTRRVFGRPVPMRYAGEEATGCGTRRIVVLRLYSGYPPNGALSRDIGWMNAAYGLGLPKGRSYAAGSPGQAQTFFGRRGSATHLLVQQADATLNDPLSEVFFRSILIEELFQSFTFGMDILMLQRPPVFQSKLQEVPLNIHRLPWGSEAFKAALVSTNPAGLCAFDVFMMHAVAEAPVEQTTEPGFLAFIDEAFDRLDLMAQDTMADPNLSLLLDPDCQPYRP